MIIQCRLVKAMRQKGKRARGQEGRKERIKGKKEKKGRARSFFAFRAFVKTAD